MRLSLPIALLAFFIISCKKNKDVTETPIPNNKAMEWDKSYGGTNYDFATSIVQLSNGDYVFAGTTRSIDGDYPGNRGGYDASLTKVSSSNQKLWVSTFGENDDDYSTALAATSDGGFLMVGYTFLNYNNTAWIIKANSSGIWQWQKTLSSSIDAKPMAIVPCPDGKFVIVGYTSPTSGNNDGWITEIDANGTTVWSKTFGGTGEDCFSSVIRNTDGSFTIAGYTKSDDGEMHGTKGSYDGWIMKVDGSGNKIWSVNLGGSDEDYFKSIAPSKDGGFVVAGYTKSTNGDIPLNKGGYEEWLVKINAAGSKEWIKTYGGANEEYVYSIIALQEGGYMTVGYTNSTTGDVLRKNNDFGAWLLKLDENGNKIGASTYGRDLYDDQASVIIPSMDGGFIMAGNQFQVGRGYDQWLVKITNF